MDLYYTAGSAPCRSVLMVAKAVGVDLNKKVLNLMGGEHLKPEFLKINPQHCVPTLVDNGYTLWESRAIIIYLAQKYGKTDSLYPKDPKKQGIVNQRIFFDADLYKAFGDYFYPQIFAKAPADPEKLKKLETSLDVLNNFLEGQTYVAGEYLTIADLALLASISTMEIADVDITKHSNIVKWYENLKKVAPGWEDNWNGCLEFKKLFKSL